MIGKAPDDHAISFAIDLFHGIAKSKLCLHCLPLRLNTFQLVLDVLKYCGCNIHLRIMKWTSRRPHWIVIVQVLLSSPRIWFSPRTKYIQVKYHFFREHVRNENINIHYVSIE